MHFQRVALGLSAALFLGTAWAAGPDPDVDCRNPQGTPEANYCADVSYQAADRELNAVYKQLSAKLEPEPARKQALLAAQRAWIAFRDQHCAFDTFESRAGTGFSGYLSACLETLTAQRSATLREYLEGLEQFH